MIYHLTLIIKNFFNKIDNNYKDNIPAIRDWSNSVYFYNKDNIKNVVSNDISANKIISNYFNLNIFSSKFASKSKRMRNLKSKFTTRQLYTSKSFIKQTINKCIVTIYTFDRERRKYNNYLFFIKKKMIAILKKGYNILKGPKASNISISNYRISKYNKLNNYLRFKNNRKYRWEYKKHINKKLKNYKINNTYNSNLLLFNILKKKNYIKQLFLWNYYKWLLRLFNFYVKVKVVNKKFTKGLKTKKKGLKTKTSKLLIIYKKINSKLSNVNNYMNKNKQFNIKKQIFIKKHFNIKRNYTLEQLNKKLIEFIKSNLPIKYIQLLINQTYIRYFKKNYKRLVVKYLYKEKRMLNNLNKFNKNNLKINNLIVGLKMLLSNIYNKNIELNIVNLKHPQLNSDILMTALSIKLKKRKSKMKLVINKCLKLIKIPQKIHIDNVNKGIYFKNINVLKCVDINNIGTSNITNKDRLNKILTTLFSNFKKSKDMLLNKTLLSNIKYKWVTGIKLQAAGRLSMRFVAARSMYKFIYKGNLRNMEYKNISLDDNKKKSILINKSVNNVRNSLKSNIEYSFASSKKRIGAFGVKGWINNN